MYNEYQIMQRECDECLPKGLCTVSPTLSSLQEVILLYIKELAFYLLRLKNFGVTNDSIKSLVVYTFFNIITNAEYNQEQFQDVISKLDYNIEQSKVLYEDFCRKNSVEPEVVKTYFKHSKKFDLTDAIKKGEKYFLKKAHSFTEEQKNLFDIMLFLCKSMFIKIVEADRLDKNFDDAYYSALEMLCSMSFSEFSPERAKAQIEKFVNSYYEVVKLVFYAQLEMYGQISATDVSFSNEIGKAILVSGSDYKKLENILKATKGTGINVYTHGLEMLMTHSFPKLRSYPNLKGHYGTGLDSSIIDFATFPGAIIMTKGTLQRIEYLYRGRLFTLDPVAPMGVIRIKDDDYEPLIKSALEAKGFTRVFSKPSVKVGYNEDEIYKKVDDFVEKIISGEFKHLYIIGLLNFPTANKQYFDRFFELLPKDCAAISLSCDKKGENIIRIDSFYDYSLVYKILKRIKTKIPLDKINISIFITKCDKHTISNVLYTKNAGIKNVYVCKCPSTLINPVLMTTLQKSFGIKEISDPQKDIQDTLNQDEK